MMDTSDTYLTITPFGIVDAVFEADATGVILNGPGDAVAHIKRVMNLACDSRGMSMSVDNIEPSDYFHFCQPQGSGIVIIQPAEVSYGSELPE